MRELDLAALMCSKLCHDLISPIGALSNGLEVLAEEDDADMRRHALDLIEASANQAAAKLKFARLAFGAGGSAGDAIDLEDAASVAAGLFQGGKTNLDWRIGGGHWPKDQVRLLLNLLVIANDAIVRGGTIRLEEEAGGVALTAEGPKASIPEAGAILNGALTDVAGGEPAEAAPEDTGALNVRAVQPYLTRLLAERLNAEIAIDAGEDRVTFRMALREAQAA